MLYLPDRDDPNRAVLTITRPYCMTATKSTGNSVIQSETCNYTEIQLFTADYQGSYVVLYLRG